MADQDFKCYHHFYNPKEEKGMYGYEDNALTIARGYYLKALKYFTLEDYDKSMFYFGATCHIIQDLTVPQHAKGKLFDNHRQFESYVKENYRRINRFKSREEPIILKSVADYANHNSLTALKIDYMYKNINDLNAFASSFLKIEYTLNGNVKTANTKYVTPSKLKNKLILQTNGEIMDAEEINLLVTIRNRCYAIKIK